MINRLTQQNESGKVRMRNRILSITRNTIPYVKELRTLTLVKGTNACILMQQLDYWFERYPNGFYKFLEPSPRHPAYRVGDSWTEELGISSDEFRTAFDKIGVRYESKTKYFEAANKFEFYDAAEGEYKEKYYCSYTDKMRHMTFYIRNHALVDAELERLQLTQISDAAAGSTTMPIYGNGEVQFAEGGEVYPDYTETTTETNSNILSLSESYGRNNFGSSPLKETVSGKDRQSLEDLRIDDEIKFLYGDDEDYDLELELARFKDYCRAKGKTYESYRHGFYCWLDKKVEHGW